MNRRNFESHIHVSAPSELMDLLGLAARRNASTRSDIVRRAVVKELAALGLPYHPGNDNADAPAPEAA